MKFVLRPNLPQNVHTVLLGEKYSEILITPLKNMGIKAIKVPDNPFVDARLSGHADLSITHLGGNLLALAPFLKGSKFSETLEREGVELWYSETVQSPMYPMDAAMNVCICGDKLIYNPKSADDMIVQCLTKDRGFTALNVTQGYTKCSVCVINEKAIITSDEIIHKRAEVAGISSLRIQPGYISLSGFDYGFIGGAALKLSTNKLAFTGKLDMHPNKNDIIEFASLHNAEIVYITNEPVFDVGSIIPIIEK